MATLQQNIMILKSYQNWMTFFEFCSLITMIIMFPRHMILFMGVIVHVLNMNDKGYCKIAITLFFKDCQQFLSSQSSFLWSCSRHMPSVIGMTWGIVAVSSEAEQSPRRYWCRPPPIRSALNVTFVIIFIILAMGSPKISIIEMLMIIHMITILNI